MSPINYSISTYLFINLLNVFLPGGGGGVLDKSLCGEVRRGPSYPDPV